ncbi:hypothetical protein Nepgr_033273 [Nepenthes gracilis]|uniref:Uncharacterized protein n=1 Tax=Nepenthes gracilis TaxID=150966 RepID=A0AAD3TK71_NEPGR|nr:hypothetical protein Nepgr_033273 [Nepenthes gracilis]
MPTAAYFIRAYAYGSVNKEVAFGQTMGAAKSTNLFKIQGIWDRHMSLDLTAAVFSALSVVSLFGFFSLEKRKAKRERRRCFARHPASQRSFLHLIFFNSIFLLEKIKGRKIFMKQDVLPSSIPDLRPREPPKDM